MARPRECWSHAVGRYGSKVRIREPRPGAPLRWDFRDDRGVRRRPEVEGAPRVRRSPGAPLDPVLVRKAENLCERKAALLALPELTRQSAPNAGLTLRDGYAEYFSPRRRALPRSRSGRKHHADSRAFWEGELGEDTPWDAIKPADVWGALVRLVEKGQVATADKRFKNLRTVHRWLRDRAGFEGLRDPTRTLNIHELLEGYEPRRPRYTVEEREKLVSASPTFGPRFSLFVVFVADSGARGGQVRLAWRSGFNCELEPPPPADAAPHGWMRFPGMKRQAPMLTFLTRRERAALDVALATYLAPWEAEYQEKGTDYPLLPSGRLDHAHGALERRPISDRALRSMWPRLEEAAAVETKPRRVFHGSRRLWADEIEQTEGLDTATHAGGWSRRETVEEVYISRRRYPHLERARQATERPGESDEV